MANMSAPSENIAAKNNVKKFLMLISSFDDVLFFLNNSIVFTNFHHYVAMYTLLVSFSSTFNQLIQKETLLHTY